MPIYEYSCPVCSHSFEVMHKISDPAPESCPHCGASSLERVVSAPHFRLKGGGWYETDFKSKDHQRNLADADSGGGAAASSSDSHAPSSQPATSDDKSTT